MLRRSRDQMHCSSARVRGTGPRCLLHLRCPKFRAFVVVLMPRRHAAVRVNCERECVPRDGLGGMWAPRVCWGQICGLLKLKEAGGPAYTCDAVSDRGRIIDASALILILAFDPYTNDLFIISSRRGFFRFHVFGVLEPGRQTCGSCCLDLVLGPCFW